MKLRDLGIRGRSETKVAKRKSTIAFPVHIWMGEHQEIALGTIECSAKGTGGAVSGVLSSRNRLTTGETYTLVCRTKNTQREWDVVVGKVLKLNHVDSKYEVEIVRTRKFRF